MKLSAYAIKEVAKLCKDNLSGREWVDLFNSVGARDVYDNGLPNIGLQDGIKTSKTDPI